MLTARQQAAYPSGRRHEFLSAKLFSISKDASEVEDIDLALHLIESHHGWARPTYPLPSDECSPNVELIWDREHLSVRADEHVADENRLWRLIDRYGYWGLALLASVVQFADRETSRRELCNYPD